MNEIIDGIRAKMSALETECENLLTQLQRSEQFAAELRTKLVHAQGKHAAHAETLAHLDSLTKS